MRIKQNPEIMTELDIDIYAGISTVCPRSRLPIFYSNLKYKLGNYFLDRRYISYSMIDEIANLTIAKVL